MSSRACISPYDPFAEVYSRWMGEDFCHRAWPAIERLLLSTLPAGTHILDVCCGAGQMARALNERGFRVTGLDASEQMLRLARENAPLAEFMLADARSFTSPCAFQGALSTFNSLAHLNTAQDLCSAFRSVRAALEPGGPFLFDLSMEAAYTSKWRGLLHFEDGDCACTIEPDFDRRRRIGRNHVTVFCGRQRVRFCIEQKCHSEEDLRTALTASGFRMVEAFDAQYDLGIPGEYGRTFFLCR